MPVTCAACGFDLAVEDAALGVAHEAEYRLAALTAAISDTLTDQAQLVSLAKAHRQDSESVDAFEATKDAALDRAKSAESRLAALTAALEGLMKANLLVENGTRRCLFCGRSRWMTDWHDEDHNDDCPARPALAAMLTRNADGH